MSDGDEEDGYDGDDGDDDDDDYDEGNDDDDHVFTGLESQLEKNKIGDLNDEVRYSIKTKSFSQLDPRFGGRRREEPPPGPPQTLSRMEEKIYDITKVSTM